MSESDILAKAVQAHFERQGSRVRVLAARRSRSRAPDDPVPGSIACLGLGGPDVHRVGSDRWVLLLEAHGRRVRSYLCQPCAETVFQRGGSA